MNKELLNNEIVKKKIREKDAVIFKSKQKINAIKQRYGIEFDIDSFENYSLKNIRFYNLSHNKDVKQIDLYYNASNDKFDSIMYSYREESILRSINRGRFLPVVVHKYKLNMVINEIKKSTNNLKEELESIDRKYESIDIDEAELDRVLEMKKSEEN